MSDVLGLVPFCYKVIHEEWPQLTIDYILYALNNYDNKLMGEPDVNDEKELPQYN